MLEAPTNTWAAGGDAKKKKEEKQTPNFKCCTFPQAKLLHYAYTHRHTHHFFLTLPSFSSFLSFWCRVFCFVDWRVCCFFFLFFFVLSSLSKLHSKSVWCVSVNVCIREAHQVICAYIVIWNAQPHMANQVSKWECSSRTWQNHSSTHNKHTIRKSL